MKKTQNTKSPMAQTQQTEQTPNLLVARKTLAWISYNYQLSDAAKAEAMEHLSLNQSLRQLIYEAPLAWKYNGQIYVALDLYKYLRIEIENEIPVIKEIGSTNLIKEDYTVVDELQKANQLFKIGEGIGPLAEILWSTAQNEKFGIGLIQHMISIGFARAAKILDYLVEKGIVEQTKEKERKIICDKATFVEIFKDAYENT